MQQLYTFGYQGASQDDLVALMDAYSAVLVDVRKQPWSKDEQFTKVGLARRLGKRYVHVVELGNVNYKSDGPVRLVDEVGGSKKVLTMLETTPVILLCGCWSWVTCHRRDAAEAIERFGGPSPIHLTRAQVPKAPPPPKPQGDLFG